MLTKEQITANIDALEKQGAKKEDIQGWLDSLKTQQTSPQTISKKGGFLSDVASIPGKIKESFESRMTGIQEAGQRFDERKQTSGESAFQALGQGAGFIGDVLGEATMPFIKPVVKNLPGVSSVIKLYENLPDEAKKQLQGASQEVIKKVSENYNNLPERARKNIEATGNIASLLPIEKAVGIGVKGVSTLSKETPAIVGGLKTATKEAATSALEKSTEKAGQKFVSNIGKIIDSSTTKMRKMATDYKKQGVDIGEEMLKRKDIPTVENDRMVFKKEALDNVEKEIAEKGTLVDSIIKSYPNVQVKAVDLAKSVAEKIKNNPIIYRQGEVESMTRDAINKIKEYAKQTGSDVFSLDEIQNFKKGLYEVSKKYKMTDVRKADASSELANIFMNVIEDNVPDIQIRALNKEIGSAIKYSNFLSEVNRTGGIVLKGGKLGKFFESLGGTLTGAGIGGVVGGGPGAFIGAFIGKNIADKIRVIAQNKQILGKIDRVLIEKLGETPKSKMLQEAKDLIETLKKQKSEQKMIGGPSTIELGGKKTESKLYTQEEIQQMYPELSKNWKQFENIIKDAEIE